MMNHGLPQIVNSRQSLTDDIRKIDKVQVEELTRLWKVYTTNKNVISTGKRLENLFWRILGSNRIQENISGNTVARIFLMIDKGEEAIQNDAYRIPPQSKSVIKQVPIDISVPPTPPPSPYSRISPSSNHVYQPSQTALSASLLQAYPNTPPSPMMPPKVPPSSPVVLSDTLVRPLLTRIHQSYPQSTNDTQVQIGREIASEKLPSTSHSGRSRRKHPQGILRNGKNDRKKRNGPSNMSRTASNSSNATASSGVSTPITEPPNLLEVSQSGRDTDQASNSVASARSRISSQKDSEAGSAKSKEDWLVEPDFRAKYLEQRKKDRLSAIAGNPIVKGPFKTGPSVATASTTAVAIPRTKKGRGRSMMLVVDSVAPLKSADDNEPAIPQAENTFAPISEIVPGFVEKQAFEKPTLFQRTKSQLSLMFEQAKRDVDGDSTNKDDPSASRLVSSPTGIIPENEDHPDDGFEDESEDEPLEMRPRSNLKKSTKSKRPKPRGKKSQ